VLELLGEMHTISNASWLSPGQSSKPLPVGALGSNILCERHNNALSDLDACAKEFFDGLLRALSKSQGPVPDEILRVDGEKLEQWVLKACCGALASGNLLEDATRVSREPPRKWLDILFSESVWEVDTGLYVRQASMTPHQGYSIGPVYTRDTWSGGGLEFAGVELFVLMDSGIEKQIWETSTNETSPLIYRPGVIRFESSLRTTEIELQWQKWIPAEGVRYFTPLPPAQPPATEPS